MVDMLQLNPTKFLLMVTKVVVAYVLSGTALPLGMLADVGAGLIIAALFRLTPLRTSYPRISFRSPLLVGTIAFAFLALRFFIGNVVLQSVSDASLRIWLNFCMIDCGVVVFRFLRAMNVIYLTTTIRGDKEDASQGQAK